MGLEGIYVDIFFPLLLVQLLNDLAKEDIGLLLIEQNLRVASEVSDSLAIMVNGQIAEHSQSQKLLNDRSMQQRLLGVGGQQGAVTVATTDSNTEIFSFNFEMEGLISDSASGQSSSQLRVGFFGNIVRAGVQRLASGVGSTGGSSGDRDPDRARAVCRLRQPCSQQRSRDTECR